jgi:hypothetical protein
MATPRRTRPTGRTAPVPSALEPNDSGVESVDVNESEGVADNDSASSQSSRRPAAGGRKSRRTSAKSSSSMPVARKSQRLISPEEQIARKRAVKSFLMTIVFVAVVIALFIGVYFAFLKENPKVGEAKDLLSKADSKLNMIDKSLVNRQPKIAREAFDEGLKIISVPMLSNAKDPVDPHNSELASVSQARQAVELAKKIRDTEGRINRVERDVKAEGNHRAVMGGFKKISDLSEAELTELEKNAGLFLKNPVEPPAGDRDEYVRDYAILVQEVKAQMFRIEQEKERRVASLTSDQERLAHGEVGTLVKQEQFKDALNKLDEFKAKFPDASFDNLRTYVEEAAKKAWESAEKYADSRYTDYKAPGIPKALGDQALKDARVRLQQVVDRFGIDEYVSQAQALLNKYPTP